MQPIALAQWAHDIRNTLGTVALYLETLERPAEPETIRIVSLTNTLIAKAAGMCSEAMRDATRGASVQRRNFDVMATIGQVFDLVAPILPKPVKLVTRSHGAVHVKADPQDIFRILFNLLHNAASVARQTQGIGQIEIAVETAGPFVRLRIVDDGPGLPEKVRARLFRTGESTTGGNGYGLAIARELAERNGGMLDLTDTASGTAFVLELERGRDERQLGRRATWAPEPSFA